MGDPMQQSGKKITLKTIYEILGEKFIISYYQRGYRWTKEQVEQLLEDIWEFSQKNKNNEPFKRK